MNVKIVVRTKGEREMKKKQELNDHVHILKRDEIVIVEAPSSGHGETAITWQDGKAIRLKTTEIKKL